MSSTGTARAYAASLLVGDLVQLRALAEQDLAQLDAWWQDVAHAPLQRGAVVPRPLGTAVEQFRSWSANDGSTPDVGFSVVERTTGQLAGHLTLWGAGWGDRSAELGVLLGPEHQGRGLGPDALRVLLRYAFDELGLHRVSLEVWAFNDRALAAYRRAGFTEEGRCARSPSTPAPGTTTCSWPSWSTSGEPWGRTAPEVSRPAARCRDPAVRCRNPGPVPTRPGRVPTGTGRAARCRAACGGWGSVAAPLACEVPSCRMCGEVPLLRAAALRGAGGEESGMDLRIDHDVHEGVDVLTVHGDVDLYSAPALRQRFVDLLGEERHDLVVDLSHVPFIDSLGLGVLVGGLRRARSLGGDLRLAGPTDLTTRVLRATGLTSAFHIHPDVETALENPLAG
ncbi:GNAT family N-acetyltransferase [Streptomyces sp. NP160]|uniref:GNAT family N-acetyltransferase n=1 Tax=Streptomyces sp. NP160 TaxID=2586637 RepID=UPI0015D61DA1|nr:GNAT family N-acetyltransferase [Streptomyces sp. NP160]